MLLFVIELKCVQTESLNIILVSFHLQTVKMALITPTIRMFSYVRYSPY